MTDPTDTKDDGNDCTIDFCQGATPSSVPAPAGTTCNQNGGKKCDGNGKCVACVANGDCAAPQTCGGGGVPNVCAMPLAVWAKSFAGTHSQRPNYIAVNAAGAAYVYGTFSDTLNAGGNTLTATPTLSDTFLVKLDTNGNHVWSRAFLGTDINRDRSVVLDGSGNVIVGSYFSGTVDYGGGALTAMGGDIVLGKYDSAGNVVWTRRYGDSAYQEPIAMTADGAGNIYVTGKFTGTFNFGGGTPITVSPNTMRDVFVAKLDASGTQVWAKGLGEIAAEDVEHIVRDAAGNLYLIGSYTFGATNFGGGALPLASPPAYAIFLVKLDPSGNHVWSKGFLSSNPQFDALRLGLDGAGNLILSGSMQGNIDFGGGVINCGSSYRGAFLAKLDAAGNHVWSQCRPGSNTHLINARAVAVDGAGNVLQIGGLTGTADLGGGPVTAASTSMPSIYLLKVDSAGVFAGAKTFHSGLAFDMALGPAGNIYITGPFGITGGDVTLDFGTGVLSSPMSQHGYVAKLYP